MPPWSAHLPTGLPPSSSSPSCPSSRGLSSTRQSGSVEAQSRGTPALHDVPFMDSLDAIVPSNSAQRPSYERSCSNPLTSIFNGGRRYADNIDEMPGNHSSTVPVNLLSTVSAQPAFTNSMVTKKGILQAGEKEMITGKCATCDSLVRWPRCLDVFRCTVCLMVNDLKPSPAQTGAIHTSNIALGSTTPTRASPSRKGTLYQLASPCSF